MTPEMPPAIVPDREIIATRLINFSKDKVFEAWSDPNKFKLWWGPNGFTNTFDEFDFRPGGLWKYTMHGPDKGHYRNECEFIAIEPTNLIYWKRYSKPLFNVCATFDEAGDGKTKLMFRMIFETPEESEKLRKFVIDKNEENFDRLEKLLQAD